MATIKKTIGIIGGGIGGIAVAVALRQFGIDVVVYEKSPTLREAGAGMMLWANATRVLHEMGLLENVLAESGENHRFWVRTNSGKVMLNIDTGEFDVPSVCTPRANLLRTLVKALPPEFIRLGFGLESFRQSNGKVQCFFENGEVIEHDALIGADGLRSRVRTKLFGESDPVYQGYTVWRGIAGYEGSAIEPGTNSETWGAGHRFGILNTGQNKFTWYATANVPANHTDAADGRKNELLRMFAGWHEPVPDLIRATADHEIMKNGAYDRASSKRWGKGLVTLLGDAAHPCTPNLGQGGGMAIEDAMVLAKCVAKEKSMETALSHYESLRFHRTKHIQQRARLIGSIGQWENRLFVAGRQFVTGLLPARLFEYNLKRVYSYQT